MYACKQCGTGNPLDSSFCKKCGTPLPADELTEARQKLSEMLDEGNSLFTEGRTDEAMLIAEAAVTANPSSHLAYSLKGLCHERLGNIGDALECYETAVGLNADSSLDKVKVAALRNRLAQRASEPAEPSRRNAMMIAVAAGVLVLVSGALAAISMSGHKGNANVAAVTTQSPVQNSSSPAGVGTATQTGTQGAGAPNATATGAPPSNTAQANPQGFAPNQTNAGGNASEWNGPPAINVQSGGSLPRPFGGVNGPITGHVEDGAGTGPVTIAPDRQLGPDPAPAPLQPNPTPPSNTTVAQTRPQDDPPGYIHIEMKPKDHDLAGGGAVDGNDPSAMTAVLKAAQNNFQLGHYDIAASKYLQVANMGGNSPHVQQRLGDCYRNSGSTDRARSAYNKAISMYQSQIKKGVDVSANQRGLETCESALKVLGG